MILAVNIQIDDKPTFFVEKILNSLHFDLLIGGELNSYLHFEKYKYKTKKDFIKKLIEVKPKKHTVRDHKSNRWKVENDIHFLINNKTKNRLQIAPVVKVKSTQRIDIQKLHNTGSWVEDFIVCVDDYNLADTQINELAINEGFENVEDFFKFFSEDYTGKIIHWTDLRY